MDGTPENPDGKRGEKQGNPGEHGGNLTITAASINGKWKALLNGGQGGPAEACGNGHSYSRAQQGADGDSNSYAGGTELAKKMNSTLGAKIITSYIKSPVLLDIMEHAVEMLLEKAQAQEGWVESLVFLTAKQ